jgi:hypothetical protein
MPYNPWVTMFFPTPLFFRYHLPLKGHYRCTRSLCYQAQTPVWSESSMDEHDLYFARSAIIGYLAVETWRVKTELIIITILQIIIITTSIVNLDFKTFAPKILAHTTCINRYWKYTQISAAKNQSKNLSLNWTKLIAKIKLGRTYCKVIKYWRLPKDNNLHTKYSRPWNIRAHEIFAPMKYLRPWNIGAHVMFAPMTFAPIQNICAYIKYLRHTRMFASHNIRQKQGGRWNLRGL